jgi:hypothetical protein
VHIPELLRNFAGNPVEQNPGARLLEIALGLGRLTCEVGVGERWGHVVEALNLLVAIVQILI